jgi:hypothetical protein
MSTGTGSVWLDYGERPSPFFFSFEDCSKKIDVEKFRQLKNYSWLAETSIHFLQKKFGHGRGGKSPQNIEIYCIFLFCFTRLEGKGKNVILLIAAYEEKMSQCSAVITLASFFKLGDLNARLLPV